MRDCLRARRGVWAARALLATLLLLGGPAAAGPAGGLEASTEVNAFTGAFQTSVPIGVPAYRGLEPKLALSYDSRAGNGPFGVGWRLGGVSVIERASPRRGVPRYDANDIYLLDGNVLIPCAQAPTSPSCAAGGSHATRVESYLRVKYESASNTWTVKQRDGTSATYGQNGAVFTTTGGTLRWGVSSMTNTKGAAVTYSWWCDGTNPNANECYLDKITYNGTVVKLYRETRTDPFTYAVGPRLAAVNYRVTTIDVCVRAPGNTTPCRTDGVADAARARAYRLAYSTTPGVTPRSLLETVEQRGRNATLNSSGVVTGGLALPALVGTYGDETVGFTQASLIATGSIDHGDVWLTGDFNGDGKSDLFFWWRDAATGVPKGTNLLYLSNSSDTFTKYDPAIDPAHIDDGLVALVGDFNGDGRSDLFFWWPQEKNGVPNGTNRLFLSNGSGGFTGPFQGIGTGDIDAGDQVAVGDFDGDGKSDLYFWWRGPSMTGTNRLYLSNGNGTFWKHENPISTDGIDDAALAEWRVGDFDGDGKSDVLFWWRQTGNGMTAGTNRLFLNYVTGSGFARYDDEISPAAIANADKLLVGDFNGDDKADLFFWWKTSGANTLYLSRGRGNGTGTWTGGTAITAGDIDGADQIALGDFNGDGHADLFFWWKTSGANTLYLGRGDGAFSAHPTAIPAAEIVGGDNDQVLVGDFNGDGKSDPYFWWPATGVNKRELYTVAPSRLLTTLTNGIGGQTQVTYTPSSKWNNTYLPVGAVFQTVEAVSINDGRGCTGETTAPCYGAKSASATSYVYQGARWRDPTAADPVAEFLGFRLARTTLAAPGGYSETYYWQRQGTIAKPEVIYKRKANGSILSFDKFFFSEDPAPPFTSLVTQAWAFECNGDAQVDANHNYLSGCRRVLTTYEWDQYANLTAEYQYGECAAGNGDCGTTGDERTAVRAFVPNTTAYLMSLPVYDEMRAGIGKTGTLLSRTRFLYDGATVEGTAPTAGLLTSKGVWSDVKGYHIAHTFGYDAHGNETSVTDPVIRTSTRTYDATYGMLVTSTTNALGHATQTAWDAVLGIPNSETSADLNVTNHYYDALGRATLSASPDGSQVKIEYLGWGSPTGQRIRTGRLLPGNTWIYDEDWFDGLGRPYKKTSANGVTELTVYGDSGKVAKKSLPYASGDTVRFDVYAYDELGRELSVTRPDGALLSRSYDDGSTTVTPPAGTSRTVHLDAFGRVTRVRETIDGVDRYTSFYHDLLGRRTKSVDPLGNQTVATYDSLGRVLQRSDPDKGLWTYTYDTMGRLINETDALGQTTSLTYDSLGRVSRRTYANGYWDSFVYDEAGFGASKGRLTTAITLCHPANQVSCVWSTANSVITKAHYDALGRRTKLVQRNMLVDKTISHAYDVAGRLSAVTYPDGEVVTYGYGTSGLALGRLTTVTGSVAGTLVSSVAYTSKGQVSSVTYGNGVTTTTGFDTHGERVASIQIGSLATIGYGYDANGQVTAMTSPQLGLTNWSYSYDAIGRLTRAVNTADASKSETYAFDALGRVTSRTGTGAYGYSDPAHVHAVTAAGAHTYAYDANGNMTSGAGRIITYDLDHRVASIVSGGATTTFTYDAQGLRVKKSGPSGTVLYVGSLYEERTGAATKYYFAGGVRVAKRTASGNQYLHADHLGSTRLVTNAAGAEVKRYEYAPWGPVIGESGTQPETHRFTGQEADDETGLMYYQARYYDPALGRFLQADGFVPDANAPQALDLYAYANNSPVNYVDPSGHAPLFVALVACVAFAIAVFTSSLLLQIAVFVIGTALTFTKSPFLQTLGMVLTGMASAALAGPLVGLTASQTVLVAGAVALAQSPISPLDPAVKKVIGWVYNIWGGITSIAKTGTGTELSGTISWGRVASMTAGQVLKGVLSSALSDAKTLVIGWALAYALSQWGSVGRYSLAIVGRFLLLGGTQMFSPGYGGALSMVGATYDLAYSLKYPDGRVYDLSGGTGGETFVFYTHTGYENPLAFGRQHIRVGDPEGGYWELGDFGSGFSGPGISWATWGATQKVKVILSPTQAATFRAALQKGAQAGGAYQGFHRDSYTYVSAALQFATGKSAADLHINPGLIHW
jgi:RHS repeat-associated protein